MKAFSVLDGVGGTECGNGGTEEGAAVHVVVVVVASATATAVAAVLTVNIEDGEASDLARLLKEELAVPDDSAGGLGIWKAPAPALIVWLRVGSDDTGVTMVSRSLLLLKALTDVVLG